MLLNVDLKCLFQTHLSDCNWTGTHNHLDHKRTLNQMVERWFIN